jgi:hypothetical protein
MAKIKPRKKNMNKIFNMLAVAFKPMAPHNSEP